MPTSHVGAVPLLAAAATTLLLCGVTGSCTGASSTQAPAPQAADDPAPASPTPPPAPQPGGADGRAEGEERGEGSEEHKGKRRMNRLGEEKSPYLQQHMYNPVDWYPWSDEAFARAKEEQKPVFLSIGYSTCHWCHVMERESFENEAIAAYLNEHFVSIKVDREERPDIDAVYMEVTQMMTGRGGWPMSVFLTPDRKPFFAGTYFPPDDRFGQRRGFPSLLRALNSAWQERREEVVRSSHEITSALQRAQPTGEGADLDPTTFEKGYRSYRNIFDPQHGGFGAKPKFPRSHSMSFLLRSYKRTKDKDALKMVLTTLDHMARGGVHDHLGGGFHRYSTDREWLVPHFEKMLYDQALIARTYLEAYQATGDAWLADVARDIFRYVLRDLTDPKGGFYSAEDADSEGVEGKFYVFARGEILEILGKEEGAFFCEVYGIKEDGNFLDEATGEETGLNILHLPAPLAAVIEAGKLDDAAVRARLATSRETLFLVRKKRIHPYKDDKILTDWNGLMISALAYGAQALSEPALRDAAVRAADFVLAELRREDGRLLHRYRQGQAGIPAHHEDYAFLIYGLVDLYEATFDPKYLAVARELAQDMVRLFWDEEQGGFFLGGADAERLITRTKDLYDGAIPSGNSVATIALLRLGRLLADRELEERGEAALKAFGGKVAGQPTAYPFMLMAADFAFGPSREIVIAGARDDPRTRAMLTALHSRFIPNKVVALHAPGEAGRAIEALLPYVKEQRQLGGEPTAYVCEGYACKQPVTTVEALEKLLDD